MNDTRDRIGPLKKIRLSWGAGRTPQSMDLIAEGGAFQFIYGIGKQGLSPLEYALADKKPGEDVLLHLDREKLPEVFEHVDTSFLDLPEDIDAFYLHLSVEEVLPADPKELIKAIAETASCGDHCCGH